MKKTVFLLMLFIVLFVFSFQIAAYQNTYSRISNEYRQLVSLYRIAGMTMHGVVTPLSSDDMLFLLDEIDLEKLPLEARKMALELRNALVKPRSVFSSRNVVFDADVSVSPVGVFNSNESVSIRELPFPFRDIEPLLLMEGTFHLGEHYTGFFGLDFIKSAGEWDFSSFDSNLELELGGSKMDFYRPHKAYFSAGFDRLNFVIGRDRMSAGSGFTGNLTIGDNFFYQDFAKVSLLYPFIGYTMTIAAFDPNETTDASKYPLGTATDSLDYSTWDEYHPEVLNHRFSFNFFNKVTLTLTEGVMQITDNAAGTVKMLNPFNVLHNQFTFRNHRINNYFAIELDIAIVPGLSTHFQFIGDQIQLKFEHADTTPNSYGLLLNIAYSFPLKDFIASAYIEGVYTSPSLYLKDDKTADGGQIPPNPQSSVAYDHRHTDLIFGNRMTGFDDYQYMGYVYGPDAIVVSAGFEASSLKSFLAASALFMVHGENRIDKETNEVPKAPVMDDDEPKFIFTPYVTDGHVPEYSLVCKLEYCGVLCDFVSLRSAIALDNRWNYGNDKSATYSNIEVLFAVRLSFAGLL